MQKILCASTFAALISLQSCANHPSAKSQLNAIGPVLTDSCLWVDRLGMPGTSELSTSWSMYTDASNHGLSKIKQGSIAEAVQTSDGRNALKIDFSLDRGGFQWQPYVGFGVGLPAIIPTDWNTITAVAYEFRGAEHNFQWQLNAVKDYGWHQKTIKSSSEWTTVIVKIADLKQPGWAGRENWNSADSRGLGWAVNGKTGDKGSVEIANIRFLTRAQVAQKSAPETKAPEKIAMMHSRPDTLIAIDSSNWIKTANFGKVKPLRWKDGKKAAYSLTFDDGFENQISTVAPILDKYNVQATFFVIPPMLGEGKQRNGRYGSWDDFVTLSNKGHEIGAHSMTHPNLSQMSLGNYSENGSVLFELMQSKLEIEKRIQKPVLSFAYPYGDVNSKILDESRKLFVAGRNVSGIVNLQDFDGINVNATGLNYKNPRDMQDDLDQKDILRVQILHNVIPSKALGVFLAHEVFPFSIASGKKDSWMPVSLETFEPFISWLAKTRDEGELWLAPLGQTVLYAKERDSLRAGVLSENAQQIVVQLATGLPQDVFNQVLDLDISVPKEWKKVKTTGALKGEAEVVDGWVRLSALPNNKIILDKIQ